MPHQPRLGSFHHQGAAWEEPQAIHCSVVSSGSMEMAHENESSVFHKKPMVSFMAFHSYETWPVKIRAR